MVAARAPVIDPPNQAAAADVLHVSTGKLSTVIAAAPSYLVAENGLWLPSMSDVHQASPQGLCSEAAGNGAIDWIRLGWNQFRPSTRAVLTRMATSQSQTACVAATIWAEVFAAKVQLPAPR